MSAPRTPDGAESTAFAEYLAARYRPETARGYARQAARYAARVDARHARYAEVLAYLAAERARGLAARSVRLALTGVRAYHAYLIDAGARTDDPTAGLRLADRVDVRPRLDQLYAADALAGLRANYRAAEAHDQRRGLVAVDLLVEQALTAGEVAAIRIGDLDLGAGTVRAPGDGRLLARTLPLAAAQAVTLYECLRDDRARYDELRDGGSGGRGSEAGGRATDLLLLGNRHGRPLHTSELGALINRGRERAAWLLPRWIRQSVIADLLDGGHDVRVVQVFAGHRAPGTTAQYRRAESDALAEAVRRLHPRG